MIGTRYQGDAAPSVMSIIIEQALPEPGLNYAESSYQSYQPFQFLGIIPIFAFNSWAPDFSTKNPKKSSFQFRHLVGVFFIGVAINDVKGSCDLIFSVCVCVCVYVHVHISEPSVIAIKNTSSELATILGVKLSGQCIAGYIILVTW